MDYIRTGVLVKSQQAGALVANGGVDRFNQSRRGLLITVGSNYFRDGRVPLDSTEIIRHAARLSRLVQARYCARRILYYAESRVTHGLGCHDQFATSFGAGPGADVNIFNRDVYQPLTRHVGIVAASMANSGYRRSAVRRVHDEVVVVAHGGAFGLPACYLGVEIPQAGCVIDADINPANLANFGLVHPATPRY